MTRRENGHLIIIDAHVHIHDCFNLPAFFNSAYENCRAEIRRLQKDVPFLGVLLLTEMSGHHWFQRLGFYADSMESLTDNSSCEWTIRRTDERTSLLAESNNGSKLVLIAGRQIVTKENLEILALATDATFNDGASMRSTIDMIRQHGGIPVIPWGFGKWWGLRGKVLTDILLTEEGTDLFLGDTSARPNFLPPSPQFLLAQRLGIRILPGSDPLPFSSEFWRPCSAGFSVVGLLTEDTPTIDLKRMLRNPNTVLSPFSKLESWYRFMRNQLAIRFVKNKKQ